MKTLLKLLLLFSTPLLAQVTQLPNMVKVTNEWVNISVPAGVKLIAQLGCPKNGTIPTAWSVPVTISGTVANNWFNLGLPSEPKCGGALPALWVQQGATAVSLTVLTTPNTTVVVPVTSAPPTGTITFPLPILGTCAWTGTSTDGTTLIITLTCTSP